ncbi:MAG: protein involved in biosynthesis of mitomycin antibiotics/polyketide fumonisin [Fimbriimonadales bacterium]|nr:MAG: protein involved in biosynthesis of mitomycin antibiotics/polyketide fumonisin [Fimbriimonadales bacterium]
MTGQAGEAFREQGFYLARGLYQDPFLTQLRFEFDRIVAQLISSAQEINARWSRATPGTTVLHTHNVQQYSALWLRALLHEPFLEVARQILGDNIVLHHTKLFLKSAEEGADFPMHQDWSYFPTRDDSMIAAVLFLTEATDEMGCLRVYPGSHKLGRIPDSSGQVESEEMAEFTMEGAQVIEAEPGDVLFFSYLLVHGSPQNRSKKPRKTVLIQMHAGEDVVDPSSPHPYEGLVLSGWNPNASRDFANRRK